MKIISTTWTDLPGGFEATTMTATSAHIIVGGERGVRYRARLAGDAPLEFVSIAFPEGLTYCHGYDWEVPIEEMEVDQAQTDWSVNPPQVAMNLREYQGGSYGLWIHGEDPDTGELLPTTHDADIGFAHSYVLRGDVLIAENYQEIEHFRRVEDKWVGQVLAWPTRTTDFEIFDLALSYDGKMLAVVTFEPDVRTGLFELREGRFEFARTVDLCSSYISCYAHHTLTLSYQTTQLHIWDGPMCGPGVPCKEVPLPDDFITYCGNDDVVCVVAGTTLELLRREDLACVAKVTLPEKQHAYAPTMVAFVDERMVILSQHRIGVVTFDQAVPPSKPLTPGVSRAQVTGYARARQIFAQFQGHDLTTNARDILTQLAQISQVNGTRETSCWWLWRGYREGRVGLCAAFSYTLSQDPEAYDVDDVFAFLDVIDHDDMNAFAHTYAMIRAKLEGHEARFVMYWALSRGVLRADLGYELATRRLVPAQALPARALERATCDLVRCHLCGPRDRSYSSRLADLQRLYGAPQIARGVIHAALAEEHLGMGLTQWFDVVWPHITTVQRVALLFKVSGEELVLWYARRFAVSGLEQGERAFMEQELSRLLVIKPQVNMFLPSNRPFEPYTFLLAAMLLGQDAAHRRVGLGQVGGATFARAIELGEQFPQMCGLTPALEQRVREIFGYT